MRAIIVLISLLGLLWANEPVLSLNGLNFYAARDVLKYNSPEDNRNIIIIFSSQRCSHCAVYKQLLASLNSRAKGALSSRYILAFSEDDAELKKMFNVKITPTTFVLDSKKRLVVAPMEGDPQDINELVEYLLHI